MTEPVQVQVVRPRKSTAEAVGGLVRPIAILFLDSWLAMLIVPVVTSYDIGYWHTVLVILLLAFVLPHRSAALSYLDWTKPAPRKSR